MEIHAVHGCGTDMLGEDYTTYIKKLNAIL